MAHPLVINCWRGPFDIYVGRGSWKGQSSVLGNPFSHHKGTLALYLVGSREEAVSAFEGYARERIKTDPEFRAAILACRGKRLGCWCAPLLCHAEIILKLADELFQELEAA